MSFAGHVFDMLKRQAANRALLLHNRERFKNKIINSHSKESHGNTSINIDQSRSPEELELIRQNTLNEILMYNRKVWIKTVITFIIIVALFILLLYL